jgi:hypothetical protein
MTDEQKPEKAQEKADKRTFVALVGINYPTGNGEKRVEAGKKVSDIPARSVSWMLEQGFIKPVESK